MTAPHADAAAMPRYRSHKEVRAAKIIDVAVRASGSARLSLEEPWPPTVVEHDMVRRYMPIAGDYLVIYEPDGYRSISPRAQFEEGYTRIE